MDLLIKNGTVINASGRCKADVAVSNGVITRVEDGITPAPDTQIADASGLLVLPGAVDVHTHFELSFGEFSSADDFMTGTRAAACGGVTTIIDFITPEKSEGLYEAFVKRNSAAAPKACIDYSFHMGITELTDAVLDEMAMIAGKGIPSFKLFMTYSFRLTDEELYKAMERARDIGALTMIHAEDHEELESRKAAFVTGGNTSPWYHYLSRPEDVETAAVNRAVALARQVKAPLYIVHLACADGVATVAGARAEGYPVYAETCPQYLNFTNDVYKRADGRDFICSPSIKSAESRDALWQGLLNDDISVVATDHCPFNRPQKDRGMNDFTLTPNGVMGVENLYPYMLGEANKGRISFERVAGLCSLNPAKLFGLAPAKGAVVPGADADIILYDPDKIHNISYKNMHSNLDHTIWEGTELKGYPVSTYSRGRLICENGKFTGTQGYGRFLTRSGFTQKL